MSDAQFKSTMWKLVEDASEDSSDGDAARRELCAIYREPILSRLRRQGCDQEAEDLANGFMVHLLVKNRFKGFVRGQAKFRSFLLECLQGYLRDEWRKETAAKRGGGDRPVPLEELEIGKQEIVDRDFDRDFARSLHVRVIARLAAEFAKRQDSAKFEALEPYILGAGSLTSYGEVAGRLGISPTNVKVSVLRVRSRYAAAFREEVEEIVSGGEVEAEMRYLISLLAEP